MNNTTTTTEEMNEQGLNPCLSQPVTPEVTTIEGYIIPASEAKWCEYFEGYTHNTFSIYLTVERGQKPREWSLKAVEDYRQCIAQLYRYENEEGEVAFFDRRMLAFFNLVYCIDNSEVRPINEAYQHSDGNYYTYEEEPEDIEPEYVRGYHDDGNTYFHHFSEYGERTKFYIGYEIEKEDIDIKESIEIDHFETEAPKWRKEEDGSLNSRTGFELISPCFELCPDKIQEYINESPMLTAHINADKSDNCGGHINISEEHKTGLELFEAIQGYTPLFHALYYKRIDKSYSKGKSNEDIKNGDKYQSIRIHRNRVEVRIISAVPNVKTLIWRTRLMEYILKNQTSDPREVFINFHDTELKALISEVYNTPEKFATLNERLIRYTRTFEHIDIVHEIWHETETAQLAKAKNVDIQKAIEDNQQTLINQVLNNEQEEENEEEEEN
jgi:hypothetical protein